MSNKKFDLEKIIKALEEKGAKHPCHRCGHNSFSVIEGFSRYNLSEDVDTNNLGGDGVPIVLVVCNNCGAIFQHAAFALIPKEKVDEE